MNRALGLWLLVLIAPVIWFINLEANFAMAGWVCQWRSRLVLALISAASLVVVAVTGLLAWRRAYSSDPLVLRTSVVLLTGGVVLSSLFFIVILAQAVPTLFLDGCQ